MKKGAFYQLLLLGFIVTSCQSPTAKEIAKFNNRPDFAPPCISNGDGTCFRDGQPEVTTNMFCDYAGEVDAYQDWIEFLEEYRYLCKKFGRCR